MAYEISETLLADVKDVIQVTWDKQDNRITKMIIQGMAYLNGKVGKVNFEADNDIAITANKLLCDYVRYDWNGYVSTFETDYLSDLLNLQLLNSGVNHE